MKHSTRLRRVAVQPAEPAQAPAQLPDVALLAQLWADQFQHMTTLALAGGGGLLVLLQIGVVEVGPRWWAALLSLALTALVSMIGQTAVVDEATRGQPPGSSPRAARAIALMCLGGSGYLLTRLFI